MKKLIWKKDGAQLVQKLISKKLILESISLINKLERKKIKICNDAIREKYKNKYYYRYIPNCHLNIDHFIKFINSKVLSEASKFLNSNVYFWDIDFHSKWGLNSDITPPHQDSFLKCLEEKNSHMLTCYIPLTKITLKSNPMTIIRGSFKERTLKHKKSKMLGFSSVICEDFSELPKKFLKKQTTVLLNPGDAFFFHGKTIHFSKKNPYNDNISNQRRIAIAIRIMGEGVKFSKKKTKEYLKNVKYNREFALKKGLTENKPISIRAL